MNNPEPLVDQMTDRMIRNWFLAERRHWEAIKRLYRETPHEASVFEHLGRLETTLMCYQEGDILSVIDFLTEEHLLLMNPGEDSIFMAVARKGDEDGKGGRDIPTHILYIRHLLKAIRLQASSVTSPPTAGNGNDNQAAIS